MTQTIPNWSQKTFSLTHATHFTKFWHPSAFSVRTGFGLPRADSLKLVGLFTRTPGMTCFLKQWFIQNSLRSSNICLKWHLHVPHSCMLSFKNAHWANENAHVSGSIFVLALQTAKEAFDVPIAAKTRCRVQLRLSKHAVQHGDGNGFLGKSPW